jgi:septal ring factor EnvC (AmiA/AmiB activator)
VCSDCPGSVCRRRLETANKLLKKKIYKTAMKLIGHFSMGNHFRRKTNNVILLKDQVAAELATTEEKLATTEEKLATTEEKLATTEEKLATTEEKLAEEQQKNHDLRERWKGHTLTWQMLTCRNERTQEKKLIATQKKAIDHAATAFGDAAGGGRWWSMKVLRLDPIIVHIIDSVNDRVNKEILEEFPDCPLLEF